MLSLDLCTDLIAAASCALVHRFKATAKCAVSSTKCACTSVLNAALHDMIALHVHCIVHA
jgi:hypothetical protein